MFHCMKCWLDLVDTTFKVCGCSLAFVCFAELDGFPGDGGFPLPKVPGFPKDVGFPPARVSGSCCFSIDLLGDLLFLFSTTVQQVVSPASCVQGDGTLASEPWPVDLLVDSWDCSGVGI